MHGDWRSAVEDGGRANSIAGPVMRPLDARNAVVLGLLMIACSSPDGQSGPQGWPTYGGTLANDRYSLLDQINTASVSRLAPVWIYQTGTLGSLEVTPLAVDGIVYLTLPGGRVVALRATDGTELWSTELPIGRSVLCCGPNNRGAALWGGMLFVGTVDARLIALIAESGQAVWMVNVDDPTEGYSITMAPLAANGMVYVGVSGGEYGIRGHLSAYAAETGVLLWRWHAIPDPNERENGWWGRWRTTTLFGDSIARDVVQERRDSALYPDAWKTGGGAVWMTPAFDPTSNTLFLGVGNPSPDLDGRVRPGDNLYTGSLVALDATHGTLKWFQQYVPHDLWDRDAATPPHSCLTGMVDALSLTRVRSVGYTSWIATRANH